MAKRRMFSMDIIDTDKFLDMPISSQLLYFHLALRADDDGFVSSPKRILRLIGASDDDLKMLFAKQYIIPFDSGVCVIKHWKIHNYIQNDRYHETMYQEEKEKLNVLDNKSYEMDTRCIQSGYKMDTQVRLGKASLGKSKSKKDNVEQERNSEPETLVDNFSEHEQQNESPSAPSSGSSSQTVSAKKKHQVPYKRIIDYLNSKAGTAFKHTTRKTKDCIKARWNEGFGVKDFEAVIDQKCDEWLTDERMVRYVRPVTLFGSKFESYLQQPKVKSITKEDQFRDIAKRYGFEEENYASN